MRSWPVYVTVVVLGAGAAVAIAGLPDDTPVDETVRTPTVAAAPSTTRAPGAGAEPTATSESTTTTSTTTTSTTVPPTTVSSTTVPPTTVSTAPSTTAPATESSTSTTTTTTTTTTPTTTTVTTTTAPPPLVERGDLEVSVANASIFGGLARRTAAELRRLGYDEVVTTNGLEPTDVSVVYHRAGLGREAERLAADLGIGAPVRPLGAAPPVLGGTDDIELLAYLGNDR